MIRSLKPKWRRRDDLKTKSKKNLLSNYNYYMCKVILTKQARGSSPFAGSG